jgi:phosphoglycerate dehydrogenase-like enzyme
MGSTTILEFVRFAHGIWNAPAPLVSAIAERHPAARITSPRDQDEADRLLPDAEVVLGWAVQERNFATAKRLRWVHVTAAGVGSLLFPAMVESDVIVTNGRGLHSEAMAEHTIGVLLAFVRKLHLARDAQRERRWAQEPLYHEPPAFGRLAGGTLLVVGLGAIGSAIATRAAALGMRVVAVRKRPAADPAPAHEQHPIAELPRLLGEADAVVLAVPLTPETGKLIGAAELARMKASAVLVNLGRGRLVDEAALIDALRDGRIAGAALDVFETEPLAETSPLWEMPQVILTPHVSGFGPAYWERALAMFEDNLDRWLDGRPLVNVVDKRAGY